jgi:hypothetical protein
MDNQQKETVLYQFVFHTGHRVSRRSPCDTLRANGGDTGTKRQPFVLSPSQHARLMATWNRELI